MNLADFPAKQMVLGMPFDEYRAVEALSASGAKKLLRSPAHYKLERDQPGEATDSMDFGTAVHAGVLEPDTFRDRVARAPKCDRRTKEGKALWEQFTLHAAGKLILSEADHDRARRCIDAVLAHPAASRLLEGAEREVSLLWADARYNVPCKARLDARKGGVIVDLKTCGDASEDGFANAIGRYAYHVQAAAYCSGCEHVLDASPEAFVFIAVESEPPYAVSVWDLPGNAILAGMHLYNIAAERYAVALRTGEWPGYTPTIQTITLPRWITTFNH